MYRPANLVFAVMILSLFALTSLLAHQDGVSQLFSNP